MARSFVPRFVSSRHFGAIASLVLMTSAPTLAFAAGTEAQREACMSDAFRLCSMAMPDEKRVENCLRAAGPRLSNACYNVFYPQEAAAPSEVTRGQAPSRNRMQPSAPQRPQNPSMPQMPPGPEQDDD